MISDNIKMIGNVDIVLCDHNNNIKQHIECKNLVVSVGKSWIASRMINASSPTMSHMGVGTSAVVPSAGNTSLSAQVARVALTNTTRTTNQITYSAFFPAGIGTGSLTEAGIFNSSILGDMLCRTVFDTINKDVSDTLTINWTVTVL